MSTVRAHSWVEGPVLVDLRLAAEVHEHWLAAGELVGEEPLDREVPADVATACDMVDDAAGWLVEELERPAGEHVRAARLLVAGNGLAVRAREAGVQWRARAFGQVHAALGRLRGATSVEQLMTMGPEELCKCGFDRAMLSRVDGKAATPVSFHWIGEPDNAAQILRDGQAAPLELDHTQLETEMIRRRGPLLVPDVRSEPRVQRLISSVLRTRCYVAAPVMPQGKVIGFFHADCPDQRRVVDEFDRDLLWMFAEGFGFAYERTILLERLRSLRMEVRRGNRQVMGVMDEFCEAEVEVGRVERETTVAAARSGASLVLANDSRLEALLTRRELDVIRLMATGETNAGIALKLIVSEGTVKSHVKHILRKLRASNRAEAVSRYIRLSQQAPMSEDH